MAADCITMCFTLCLMYEKATSHPFNTLTKLYFGWRTFVLNEVQECWTDAKWRKKILWWTSLASATHFNWGLFPISSPCSFDVVSWHQWPPSHISIVSEQALFIINLFHDSHALPFQVTLLQLEISQYVHSWKKSYSVFDVLQFSAFFPWVNYKRFMGNLCQNKLFHHC